MEEILVLGLNPAWQRLFELSALHPGAVQRLPPAQEYASGKGVNCARVLAVLGARACVAHFLGGASGERLRAELRSGGLEQLDEAIADPTRICTTLAVAARGTQPGYSTELIEPSPVVTADEAQALRERLRAQWSRFRSVAVCGSFPAGCAGEALLDLPTQDKMLYIDAVQGVDAWMRQGVELLKVNAEELQAIMARLGLPFPAGSMPWGSAALALRTVWPVRHLVVTCAEQGAYWVDPQGACWHLPVWQGVQLRNAIGAGDAFLAGWIQAASTGAQGADCFCAAAATAQARCEAQLPWEFTRARRDELRELLRSVLQEVP